MSVAEKLKKLRRMRTDEIAYRTRERVRVEAERIRLHLPRIKFNQEITSRFLLPFPEAESSLKRYLRTVAAGRFYLPDRPDARAGLRHLVETKFPEWRHEALEEAQQLCAHQVELLGFGKLDLGAEIDWNRDPVSGRIWPQKFWSDYDLVRESTGGDPKCIHELNRHQHLPRIAKAFFLSRDERYAVEAFGQLKSWINQNPPGLGINWNSSLEIALRTISWFWTLFLLIDSDFFTEDAARLICRSLAEQLDHVYSYPSIFSSPNTHVLGEASSLMMGGIILAEHEHAFEWLSRGTSLLEVGLDQQVSEDGVHGELSSYYHCYTLDFYLQLMILADKNKVPFARKKLHKIISMLEFLMHLMRPDGTIPLIGDDDGGRALALRNTNYGVASDALCTGAILFQRPDFKARAKDFSEQTLWLLGENSWDLYSQLPSEAPPFRCASFPKSGYFIQRTGWGDQHAQLIFDCGGMGIINGGHGHADSLSLTLFANGKDLLVDPGTFTYNADAEWRNFFRSSRAHNAAIVDMQEQSQPGGTFSWNRLTRTRLSKHLNTDDIDYIEAEHNGFAHLGITHRRRVLFLKPKYWAVIDEFKGTGEHEFDLYYHFSPEVHISFDAPAPASSLALTGLIPENNSGVRLFFQCSSSFLGEILYGQTSPIQGWVSRRYGEKRAAPVFRLNLRTQGPTAVLSLLIPFSSNDGQLESNIRGASHILGNTSALSCLVKDDISEDILLYNPSSSPLEAGVFSCRGELFCISFQNRFARAFGVNAMELHFEGRELFSSTEPRDFNTMIEMRRPASSARTGVESCARSAEL